MTEALQFGWDTMKKNIGFFIVILVAVFLFYIIANSIQNIIAKYVVTISLLIGLAIWFIQRVIEVGFLGISLKFCDNAKVVFSDIWGQMPLVMKYILSSLLYGLIILGGIILLVIPGIIWGIQFQFFSYFIVDKGLGPIEALKKSSAITRGVKFELLFFGILVGLINLLGALVLLVGLFATIPTTMVAYAYVYRALAKQTDANVS
jgi:uncharacterized membrane protein